MCIGLGSWTYQPGTKPRRPKPPTPARPSPHPRTHPAHPSPGPQYFRKKKTLLRHLAKCTLRHPPGDEIYRSPPAPANDPSYVGGAVTNPPIR